MSTMQQQAVALGIVPRAGRLPSDLAMLETAATLAFCPALRPARRARAEHISSLIADALEGK
jgi:hypothetical protein